MTIFSLFPDTTISKTQSSNCSLVGLKTKSAPIIPTRTVAIGPFQGMFETNRAADAPTPAQVSEIFSPSLCKTVIITWVSFLNDFGNKGLIGLSVSLLVKTSPSVGLASLLKKPPGIFPLA